MKNRPKSSYFEQKLFQIDVEDIKDYFRSREHEGWHLVIPPTDRSTLPPILKDYWEGYDIVQQANEKGELCNTIRIPVNRDSPRYALDMYLAMLAIASLEGTDILEVLDRFSPIPQDDKSIPMTPSRGKKHSTSSKTALHQKPFLS
jgi:hypothetical protein